MVFFLNAIVFVSIALGSISTMEAILKKDQKEFIIFEITDINNY
jgi:hypothetical protein